MVRILASLHVLPTEAFRGFHKSVQANSRIVSWHKRFGGTHRLHLQGYVSMHTHRASLDSRVTLWIPEGIHRESGLVIGHWFTTLHVFPSSLVLSKVNSFRTKFWRTDVLDGKYGRGCLSNLKTVVTECQGKQNNIRRSGHRLLWAISWLFSVISIGGRLDTIYQRLRPFHSTLIIWNSPT